MCPCGLHVYVDEQTLFPCSCLKVLKRMMYSYSETWIVIILPSKININLTTYPRFSPVNFSRTIVAGSRVDYSMLRM